MKLQRSADASASPAQVTNLILRIFRANGALLAAGDRLVAPTGLTSARWQLLGTIAEQDVPLSVAQIAREMSVTRQAVQRIVNELEAGGILAFRVNPRHKRAYLVEMTDHGRSLFDQAMAVQLPWAAQLGRGQPAAQVEEACAVLDKLLRDLATEDQM